MGKQYLKKLPQIYEFLLEDLEEDNLKVKTNGLPKIVGSFYASRSGSIESIALCDYLVGNDIRLMKNRFYNAAQATIRSMKWYDANKGEVSTSGNLSLVKSEALEWAIISDSKKTVIQIANILGARGDLDSEAIGELTYNIGYALKYIVQDEYDKARVHINKLFLEQDSNYFSRYENVLLGIIENNEIKLKEGLENMLKNYKKSKIYNNTPEEFFSIPVIAMAKLAKMKGFEVDIDDPVAPKQVIDFTEVNYELIDFLKIEF